MTKSFRGACSCGEIRFEAEGTPYWQGFCRCPDCRRAGCGHSAEISMAAQDVTITGESRSYTTTGLNGGLVHRSFCPTCGTSVFNHSRAGATVTLNAALLDDPSVFQPEVAIFEQTALPWDYIDPRIPRSELD